MPPTPFINLDFFMGHINTISQDTNTIRQVTLGRLCCLLFSYVCVCECALVLLMLSVTIFKKI